MIATQCLLTVFLLFIALTSGSSMHRSHNPQNLIDPRRPIRESCRKHMHLSEAQLKVIQNDHEKFQEYMVCFAHGLGDLNKDNTFNRNALIKSLKLLAPMIIAVPIIDCCVDEVYHGEIPPHHERIPLFLNFVKCFQRKAPPGSWELLGITEPPTYSPLNTCSKRW